MTTEPKAAARPPQLGTALIVAFFALATIPTMFVVVLRSAPMPPAPVKIVYAESEVVSSFGSAQALVESDLFRHGREVFAMSCTACHTEDGGARTGLGKDVVSGVFSAGATDHELADMIRSGRPSSHPLNTTGIDMPPRGGNPALNDGDIKHIVAFIRGQQAIRRGVATE